MLLIVRSTRGHPPNKENSDTHKEISWITLGTGFHQWKQSNLKRNQTNSVSFVWTPSLFLPLSLSPSLSPPPSLSYWYLIEEGIKTHTSPNEFEPNIFIHQVVCVEMDVF